MIIPLDILIVILELGCELEFEILPEIQGNSENSGPLEYAYISWKTRRFLKPFALPAAGVCKEWRETIQQASSLWVTSLHITIPDDKFKLSPQELFKGTSDDIDILLKLDSPNESIDWLKTQLLPFSHRIRKLDVAFASQSCAVLLLGELAKESLPKLRCLKIKSPSNCSLSPPDLIAPCLKTVCICPTPWYIGKGNFLRNLTGLGVAQVREEPWLLVDLGFTIRASASSIVNLNIDMRDYFLRDLPVQSNLFPLHLHRLSRLYIYTISLGCLVRLLEVIVAPTLSCLILLTHSLTSPGNAVSLKELPFRSFHFNTVQDLSVNFPENCFTQLFSRLMTPNLRRLALFVRSPPFGELVPPPTQMKKLVFDKLEYFHLRWTSKTSEASRRLSLFFDFFEVSGTTMHANINVHKHCTPLKRLEFPLLPKLYIDSASTISHVSVPSLRHLIAPVVTFKYESSLWIEAYDMQRLPFDRIACLQLDMSELLKPIADLQPGPFYPFTEVTTLIITHSHTTSPLVNPLSSNVKYGWPICWRTSPFQNPLRKRNRGALFPGLNTLQVAFPERDEQPSLSVEIVREIEIFLSSRKRLGYPISHLRINYIPASLGFEIVRLAKLVEELQVEEYIHSKELSWLNPRRDWPQ